jgi:ATP-dependent helicase/nuclease subunit A
VIARDIIERYNSKQQVFDKDTGKLRNITYSDFSIIMDRATNFDLYKKVFSYFGIPITILKDEKMNESDDVLVIRNLIKLILKIRDNVIDTEFKYLFVSIMRSFLYNISDDDIMDYFIYDNFKTSELYIKCLNISRKLNYITISNLLDIVVEEFDYYDKLITIGNIHNSMVKLDKIIEIAGNLEKLGYDIDNFSEYLQELTKNGYSMDYKVADNGSDSVKIMTIHKSKGLEYPICYFSGLYKTFNISDLKEKFIYDAEYGIIVPYFKEGIGQTIYKELLKDKYLLEEISEKIRLFYVALTRAREKMILIRPYNDKARYSGNETILSNNIKCTYRSLSDIIDSVEFRIKDKSKNIDINKLNLSKDYNLIKAGNYKDSIEDNDLKLGVSEIKLESDLVTSKNFSKNNNKLISFEEYNNMQFGTKIHEMLELTDLKNPDYYLIDDSKCIDIIKTFLDNDKVKNIKDAIIYKEYEFIYESDNTKYHGIIDLMLEYNDHIDIIDYKLKNTKDDNYNKQLKGYRDYIATKSNKKINLYLYSLLEGNMYEVK